MVHKKQQPLLVSSRYLHKEITIVINVWLCSVLCRAAAIVTMALKHAGLIGISNYVKSTTIQQENFNAENF